MSEYTCTQAKLIFVFRINTDAQTLIFKRVLGCRHEQHPYLLNALTIIIIHSPVSLRLLTQRSFKLDWFKEIANPLFMPHGHCYLWRPEILWMHIISDAVIALAYYAIPAILAIFLIRRKKLIPYPEVIVLFVAFIFLCGTTHVAAIVVTWVPLYEQQGWIKAATALISIATAVILIPKLPKLITLPGIQEAYLQTQDQLKQERDRNQKMQAIYNDAIDREEKIVALKQEVNQLLAAQGKAPKYLQSS